LVLLESENLMAREPAAQEALKKLPAKWALAVVVALILYGVLQPVVNQRFGWQLPSLASSDARVDEAGDSSAGRGEIGKPEAFAPTPTTPAILADQEEARHPSASKPPIHSSSTEAASASSTPGRNQSGGGEVEARAAPAESGALQGKLNLKYGFLQDLGRENYLSPAGLRYTPGSEEGHRLKHLERHLSDLPDRPGKHGVFDGDMEQALRWIDDAYSRGLRGAKGVTKRAEEGRVIYEVPFTNIIGYVGGRDGRRTNNPPAKRLRLVVDGDRFITGFPY
jgi:hypothetical protein